MASAVLPSTVGRALPDGHVARCLTAFTPAQAAVLHAYKSIGALVGEMPRDIIIAAGAALVYKQARPMVLEVNSTATGSFLLLGVWPPNPSSTPRRAEPCATQCVCALRVPVLAIFFVMQFHKMRCLCEKLDGRA